MHISRMENGNWRAIVQSGGQRRSAVGKSKAEAQRLGARLLLEMGSSETPNDMTVGDLIESYVADSKLALTTAEDYRYLLQKVPAWMKAWKVTTVTPMMIDKAYIALGDGGWSPHRIRRLHSVLRPAFKRATRWGWIDRNPVESATPPESPNTRVTTPTPTEVARLLAAADAADINFGCALRVAATTGVRRGELCGLQWGDLDEETATLNVRRSVSTTTADAHGVTEGKTGRKGHRVLALSPPVVAALRSHRARQAEFALRHGMSAPKWIFTADGSRPWRTDYVTLAFARIRDGLGLGHIRLHDLRHFVGSNLISSGMDIRTVSGRLGHARTSTTLDIYADFMPARDREAAEIMERSIGPIG